MFLSNGAARSEPIYESLEITQGLLENQTTRGQIGFLTKAQLLSLFLTTAHFEEPWRYGSGWYFLRYTRGSCWQALTAGGRGTSVVPARPQSCEGRSKCGQSDRRRRAIRRQLSSHAADCPTPH